MGGPLGPGPCLGGTAVNQGMELRYKAVSDGDVKRRPEAVAVGGNERVWIRQLLEMRVSAGV